MGVFFLVMAASLWGMIGPLSKATFALGFSPLETAFWRGSIAGLAFLIHGLVKRYEIPKDPKQLLGIIFFGIFGVALLEGSYVYAIQYGGAALASVLLYSAPIWVNLASLILFKEKIPRRRWLALATTLLGVIGICLWGATAQFSVSAIVFGLLSGLSYAGFYLAGKIFFHRTNPVIVYMIAFPVGSLTLWPLMSEVENLSFTGSFMRFGSHSPEAWVAFIGQGLICTYLPYWLYSKGLKLVDAGRAAIVTMVEPVVSVAMAALLFNERFSAPGYLFAALVILGVTLS